LPAQPTDQIGVSATALKLGALQDNGGPTRTHALLFNSVAIDQGYSDATFVDQRGFNRPVDYPGSNVDGGDSSDVGAYEFGGVVIPPELRIARAEGGAISLQVFGAPFTAYSIQVAPAPNGPWAPLGEVTTDANGSGEFRHSVSASPPLNSSRGFYRLVY
jgi:hypothetical protein